MKKKFGRFGAVALAGVMVTGLLAGCGSSSSDTDDTDSASSGAYYDSDMTVEEILTDAQEQGKVGNWGLGNEYELEALLTKYDLSTDYLSQAFDMDGFDDDSILVASAMTYNELGLVVNDYDGALGYGDSVGVIDMNDEGVAMLEDNLFCTQEFAEENPNTVAAFIYASMKGWEWACENPDEAAEIVYSYGSSVSSEHQAYMAEEVAKLVQTDMDGNTVTDYGIIDDDAMQQTLELAQEYIELDDSEAAAAMQELTVDDISDSSYWDTAAASDGTFDVEQTDVTIQLKWLAQAQFMGYYVALYNGYYDEVGLNVTITPGGGDISETTTVYSGQADFGVTWVSNLISADAAGMDLVEVSQVYQRSGLVLVYKLNQ